MITLCLTIISFILTLGFFCCGVNLSNNRKAETVCAVCTILFLLVTILLILYSTNTREVKYTVIENTYVIDTPNGVMVIAPDLEMSQMFYSKVECETVKHRLPYLRTRIDNIGIETKSIVTKKDNE